MAEKRASRWKHRNIDQLFLFGGGVLLYFVVI